MSAVTESTVESTMTSPLLTTAEAAAYLTVPEGTVTVWRARHKGPRYVKMGRNVRYRREALDEFMLENERGGDPR